MRKHHHETPPTAAEVAETEEIEGAESVSEASQHQAEIERLSAERKQVEDQLLRTLAEFQNYRKRKDAETESNRLFATEKLITHLLPVLDNLERTIEAMDSGASFQSVHEGIKAVEKQLRAVLEGHNVTRIDAEGQQFDPDLHDAIAAEHTEDHPENTVVGEIQPGYRIAEKVIRPSRVRVSRKP